MTRTRRARGSLDAQAILDAAERVAAGGIEALTIRGVAAEIDAAPMALYRYYPTKDAIVEALLDRVLSNVRPRLGSDDWIDDLRAFSFEHARTLIQHPWAVVPLFTHPTPGPEASRIAEEVLRILARGGIEGEDAVAAYSGMIALNYGWAAFAAPRTPESARAKALRALPPGRFPYTAAVVEPLSRYAGQANYEQSLEFLLAGIAGAAR
jgi:AcrR family transcriptional regulator